METKQSIPLSAVKAGQTVTLTNIDAGRGLNSRLASMGLLPNVCITVVRNTDFGPIMIKVKGSKMMLGKGMAQKIMVL
ncbi:MAG: ferrous iron transport protein A [Planctomycetes bacterium]|nr:ferrous iron transport protein A [Planctomycetota bacterium]